MARRMRLPRRFAALGAAAIAAAASVPLTATSAAALSPYCISGRLMTYYQSAEDGQSKPWKSTPVRNAGVQLWGTVTSTETAHPLLATTQYTDPNTGTFNVCYTPTSTAPVNSMWVKFSTEYSDVWKVSDTNHNLYTWSSGPLSNVAWNYSYGDIYPYNSADLNSVARPWHAFDTINDLWQRRDNTTGSACWSAHEPNSNSCAELNIQWTPASADGPSYDLANTIHLSAADPDSAHTVLHEAGHFLMQRLFNGWFPTVTGCSPHFIPYASSATCAWTEGWADSTAAYVLGDYRYVFDNGDSQSFTLNSPYVSGTSQTAQVWDSGDQVQGNVDGALLDLWADPNLDQNWNKTVVAMTNQTASTFSQYFKTLRPAAGLSIGQAALNHLSTHTINY